MATDHNVRVGDADRDAIAAQLREHYAQGRLTLGELNQRLELAFAARTRTDLDSVTRDLPYTAPSGVLPSDRARHRGQGWSGTGAHGTGWSGAAGSGSKGQDWGSRGYGARSGRRGPAATAASFGSLMLVMAICLLVLGAFGFGLGSGPSLVVILMAALGVLRRLFGWRRGRGPLGRSRRRGRPW